MAMTMMAARFARSRSFLLVSDDRSASLLIFPWWLTIELVGLLHDEEDEEDETSLELKEPEKALIVVSPRQDITHILRRVAGWKQHTHGKGWDFLVSDKGLVSLGENLPSSSILSAHYCPEYHIKARDFVPSA
eukprot:1362576-Amphidinium_carterae.1